jgi:hypothetical protein
MDSLHHPWLDRGLVVRFVRYVYFKWDVTEVFVAAALIVAVSWMYAWELPRLGVMN